MKNVPYLASMFRAPVRSFVVVPPSLVVVVSTVVTVVVVVVVAAAAAVGKVFIMSQSCEWLKR